MNELTSTVRRADSNTRGAAANYRSVMRDVLRSILALQPSWSAANSEDMELRGYYVRLDGPEWIRSNLDAVLSVMPAAVDDLDAEGRDGTGLRSGPGRVQGARRRQRRSENHDEIVVGAVLVVDVIERTEAGQLDEHGTRLIRGRHRRALDDHDLTMHGPSARISRSPILRECQGP